MRRKHFLAIAALLLISVSLGSSADATTSSEGVQRVNWWGDFMSGILGPWDGSGD